MQTGIAVPAVTVRAAVPADPAAMAALHVRAWRATYAGMLPDAFLAALKIEEREAMWRRSVTRARPRARGAGDPGRRGGRHGARLRAAGHARGDDEFGLGELYAINVDPPAWGRGAGRALLAAATAWLDARFPRLDPVGRRPQPARAHALRAGGLVARRRDEDRGLRRDEREQLPLPPPGDPRADHWLAFDMPEREPLARSCIMICVRTAV